MGVGSMLLGIGAAEILRRRLDMTRHSAVSRTLFAVTALQISSVITFGLTGNFTLALLASWDGSLLHSVIEPLQDAWLVPKIDPQVRATVLSMMSQARRVGPGGRRPARRGHRAPGVPPRRDGGQWRRAVARAAPLCTCGSSGQDRRDAGRR